jgi:hypothetical protein
MITVLKRLWCMGCSELEVEGHTVRFLTSEHHTPRGPSAFLGLPPGWRFLIAGEHEDVWEDPSLLNV